MKKFVVILFTLIFTIVSCKKISVENTSEKVIVSFMPVIQSDYACTKVSFSDEVLNNLEYNYPKTIILYGIDNNTRYILDLTQYTTFSIQKGTYVLNCDTGLYDTSCNWRINKTVPLTAGRTISVTNNGKTYYGERIEITESNEYTIPLFIDGLIVACEKNKVSYLIVNGNSDLPHETKNYYFYILAYPKNITGTTTRPANITIEMGGTNEYETTRITKTISSYDVVRGAYFIYSPNVKENRIFNFIIDDNWRNGDE